MYTTVLWQPWLRECETGKEEQAWPWNKTNLGRSSNTAIGVWSVLKIDEDSLRINSLPLSPVIYTFKVMINTKYYWDTIHPFKLFSFLLLPAIATLSWVPKGSDITVVHFRIPNHLFGLWMSQYTVRMFLSNYSTVQVALLPKLYRIFKVQYSTVMHLTVILRLLYYYKIVLYSTDTQIYINTPAYTFTY